jgi:hypothetical protein
MDRPSALFGLDLEMAKAALAGRGCAWRVVRADGDGAALPKLAGPDVVLAARGGADGVVELVVSATVGPPEGMA